jgi:hypothetical protein
VAIPHLRTQISNVNSNSALLPQMSLSAIQALKTPASVGTPLTRPVRLL